jgi:hypothetical protein
MPDSFKQSLTRNLQNLPGWRTKRKIVVLESDDWGSIRMASKKSFDYFLSKGLDVDKCPYNSNDSLESNEDLELLFETLNSVKDINGNPAILTANNIVANPDFEKIKADNFQKYHYELFTDTLKKYPQHDRVLELYKEGINNKVIHPQSHSREHVNVSLWMKTLQENDELSHLAFEQSMFSVHPSAKPKYKDEFMDAFGSNKNIDEQKNIIKDGLSLFGMIWGYKSKSFIAPSYTWNPILEETLSNEGVKYLQGIMVQKTHSEYYGTPIKKKFHYQGQKNKYGQRYLVRNSFFEPTLLPGFDWVNDCMNRIDIAFKRSKPAIIGSHRLNFIGFINQENRSKNLKSLSELLTKIKKSWSDVEFMSSDKLGDIMNNIN